MIGSRWSYDKPISIKIDACGTQALNLSRTRIDHQ